MIYYNQKDQRWANMRLGKSNATMWRFGCTTTALAMGLTACGAPILPSQIAAQDEAYLLDGRIIWGKLTLPGGFKFKKRVYMRQDSEVIKAIKDPNAFVLLQVDNGHHWVLAMSKTLLGSSFNVADPWTASKCDVIRRYKNITGYALFSRV